MTSSKPILCFGEVLWDSLPQGLFPGGAPINVAYHLKQLGARAIAVTAVGKDVLGDELLRRMSAWGLETEYVSVLPDKPTGIVRVELSSAGSPSYEIVENVAWDWIVLHDKLLTLASRSAAIVFGSLAQRSDHNQHQLETLRQHASEAFQAFDVNLRPPFSNPDLIWKLARDTDLIKLNDQELHSLLENNAISPESAARTFSQKTGCPMICVTAGPQGAGLLSDGRWFWTEGRPIAVKDTVGAGDSFLAALVKGLLDSGFSAEQQSLEHACRLAEFVASREGATPAYSVSDLFR